MKLAVIYNVFDGEELLQKSIEQIRPYAALVIAVSQQRSNYGEYYEDGHRECIRLKELGLIDEVLLYEPNLKIKKKERGLRNEISKRQLGLEIAKTQKATHFLLMDCDEFYDPEGFAKAVQYAGDDSRDGTVVLMKTYFKYPQWQIEGLDDYYVPFVHRLDSDTVCGISGYPHTVDPSRSTSHVQKIDSLPADCIVMHHYSWIRRDINRKTRNSSAKVYLDKHQKRMLTDYTDARLGRKLFHWKNKEIVSAQHYFGVDLGTHLVAVEKIHLCIKFPTRGRPSQFFRVLNQYIELMHQQENYSIIVSCDTDDATMNNEKVINQVKEYPHVQIFFGDNKSKIEAVNANLQGVAFDVLLLASDDMIPQIKGYDTIIREKMFYEFPDTDGVLWFNDGLQGSNLNTLCILGKKYYDRFGYIYHPNYKSLWCDNEFTAVSKQLKKYVYCEDVIIKHEHPAAVAGMVEDELYQHNNKFESADRMIYENRKKKNFGLPRRMAVVRMFSKVKKKLLDKLTSLSK